MTDLKGLLPAGVHCTRAPGHARERELKSTPWSSHRLSVVWSCIYLEGHLFLIGMKVLLGGLAVTLTSKVIEFRGFRDL